MVRAMRCGGDEMGPLTNLFVDFMAEWEHQTDVDVENAGIHPKKNGQS